MRAIAVCLVLLYHAGVPGFAGGFVGVDVFFVVSGFLITGLILREVQTTGGFDIMVFYARRARRLLPATAAVLIGVCVITLATLPYTLWATTAQSVKASAIYVVNWHFAQRAIDYLASSSAASPVQHFWSLAVEEQFYLMWPILILALLWASQRFHRSLRNTLPTGIALIAIPSFIWSVHLTAIAPRQAFFVSTTRAWELGIGAALALALNQLRRIRPNIAHLLGWVGLAAIIVATLTFDETTPFPSYAALLPTAGTAALIAGGTPHFATPLKQFLGIGPMQTVGNLSYSLYLWHWPILVGATWLWAKPGKTLPPAAALAAVAVAVLPAWLNYRVVEAPIHHSAALARNPHRSLAVGLACTGIGLLAGSWLGLQVPRADVLIASSVASPSFFDANLPDTQLPDLPTVISPSPIAALQDVATLDGKLCIENPSVESAPCTYGSLEADVVIAVVGDSKMNQWLPAIEQLADQHNWRIETYLANSCALVRVPVETFGSEDEACSDYNHVRYSALLANDRIDYIITSQRAPQAYYPDESMETRRRAMVEDLRRTWTEFVEDGVGIIVLLDTPSPPFTIPDCVAAHPNDLSTCTFSREEGFRASAAPTQLQALNGLDGVASVDLYDWICPTESCPAVIGNVLVYRQGSHLTATYVDTLVPRLDAGLQLAMDTIAGHLTVPSGP